MKGFEHYPVICCQNGLFGCLEKGLPKPQKSSNCSAALFALQVANHSLFFALIALVRQHVQETKLVFFTASEQVRKRSTRLYCCVEEAS